MNSVLVALIAVFLSCFVVNSLPIVDDKEPSATSSVILEPSNSAEASLDGNAEVEDYYDYEDHGCYGYDYYDYHEHSSTYFQDGIFEFIVIH